MHTPRTRHSFQFSAKPHLLIIEAPFHRDVADALKEGALAVIKNAEATHDTIEVPGALEIPAAILYAVESQAKKTTHTRYDGYIALGCVIKGGTMHDEIVGMESARGLQDLALRFCLAIGNGILTCNNKDQALERAMINGQDRGGDAAEAALRMIELKQKFRL